MITRDGHVFDNGVRTQLSELALEFLKEVQRHFILGRFSRVGDVTGNHHEEERCGGVHRVYCLDYLLDDTKDGVPCFPEVDVAEMNDLNAHDLSILNET